MSNTTQTPMDLTEVKAILADKVRQSSNPGKVEDGTRVHVRYHRIPGAKVSERAKEEALRASGLGLPTDAYTGRISRVWTSAAGDTILSMYVELERDHTYRSFNIDKGSILNIVILGE